MNLTELVHAQGLYVTTVWRWYRKGTLPVPARKAGRLILVSPGTAAAASPQGGADLPCRDLKAGLDRQVGRLSVWAVQAGLRVVRMEAEVGSGINGTRARARRWLADLAASVVVVVEHRDRLGRVNTEPARAALAAARGRRLVVAGSSEVTGGLVRDMIEVLTSLCAGLYGRRPARNRALKAVGCARQGISPLAVLKAGSALCGGGG